MSHGNNLSFLILSNFILRLWVSRTIWSDVFWYGCHMVAVCGWVQTAEDTVSFTAQVCCAVTLEKKARTCLKLAETWRKHTSYTAQSVSILLYRFWADCQHTPAARDLYQSWYWIEIPIWLYIESGQMGSLPVFVDLESSWVPSHQRRKRQGNGSLKTGCGIWQVKLEEEQFDTFKLLSKDGSNNCPWYMFNTMKMRRVSFRGRRLLVQLDFLFLFTPYCFCLI